MELRELSLNNLLDNTDKYRYKNLYYIGYNHTTDIKRLKKLCTQKEWDLIVVEPFEPNLKYVCTTKDKIINKKLEDLDPLTNKIDILVHWHGPEHLEKEEYIKIIEKLKPKLLIVGSPNGHEPQKTIYGNQLENHKSTRTKKDYNELGYKAVVIDDTDTRILKYGHITAWKYEKDFDTEFEFIKRKIDNKSGFALVRFGDGELSIIQGKSQDLGYKGEHIYKSGEYENQRKKLKASMYHRAKDYYIGLPCSCCLAERPDIPIINEDNKTFANIFVNNNYKRFNDLIAGFNTRKICYVGNEKSDISKLPFSIEKFVGVGKNCWIDTDKIIEELQFLNKENGRLVIFCAGVASNIMIYELFQKNRHNQYIDFGSVFDDMVGLGKTRGYLRGLDTINKICKW